MVKVVVLVILIAAAGVIFTSLRLVGKPTKETPKQEVVTSLSSEEAIAKVRDLPAVEDYLTRVPNGRVEQSGSEGDIYLIQVYEIKDGHTATFNWYRVNKMTGEIKAEFEISEES